MLPIFRGMKAELRIESLRDLNRGREKETKDEEGKYIA